MRIWMYPAIHARLQSIYLNKSCSKPLQHVMNLIVMLQNVLLHYSTKLQIGIWQID